METLARLAFEQLLWLLLLPLPWVSPVLARLGHAGQTPRHYAEPHLLPWLSTGPRRSGAALLSGATLLAWLLGVVAASGPYLRGGEPPGGTLRGLDIAVIVDISPSMGVADIAPNRLARARLELRDFVAALEADRTALVLYAANAYPVLPLTHDREVLANFIEALEPGLAPRRGSNLAPALDAAARLLAPARAGARAIVLLSDGEAHDEGQLAAATRALAGQRIPVFAIGVGTAAGGPVPDSGGRLLHGADGVVISRLDRAVLERLAGASGGAYITLRDDDGDWRAVSTGLDALRDRGRARDSGPTRGTPLFPWLLGASLLLFVAGGARRATLAALAAMPLALWTPAPAEAGPWTEQRAYRALSDGDYAAAAEAYRDIDTFNGRLGLGASAYRRGAWTEALAAFERAGERAANDDERARAAYNSGNALARLGRLEEARHAYEQALALRPGYPRAALNLGLVVQERLRLDPERPTPEPRPERRTGPGGVPDDAPPGTPAAAGTDPRPDAARPSADTGLGAAPALDPARVRAALGDDAAALLRLRLAAQDRDRPAEAQARPW